MKRIFALTLVCAMLTGMAGAASAGTFPQVDSSTARIPITDAIYKAFVENGAYEGPAPICSKTRGAWLNLADGNADIAFLIGPDDEEFARFEEQNLDIEMKWFGSDALVFLGNAANPLSDLTAEQIRAIYGGAITNWSTIKGGPDAGVVVYIRNPESGSQRLFESLVWAGRDMPDFSALSFTEGEIDPVVSQREKSITIDGGMESVTRYVMADQYAIAFNILSYVDHAFLKADGEGRTVVTTGRLHMREGPGLEFDDYGSIRAGLTLKYLGQFTNDGRGVTWYLAEHPTEGAVWLSSRYAKLTGEASTALKLFSIDGIAPTTENLVAGQYPFATNSYVAIRADEPEGSPARMLFDWVGSDESRKIIEENSTLSVAFSEPIVLRTRSRASVDDVAASIDTVPLTREALYPFTAEDVQALLARARLSSGNVGRANAELIGRYAEELARANANRKGIS